ncbi:hypothetical protein ACQX58_19990, partial [Salmonella enterica]|uniref:hypothetical protein n=1 Tax=Salmonella enterica TaxID=28901 RepID=UPI003D25E8C6
RVHQAQEGWKLPDTKLWKSPILPRSLPPQGFPVFLQLNRVWVLRDHALIVVIPDDNYPAYALYIM